MRRDGQVLSAAQLRRREVELIHTVQPTGSEEVRALVAEIAKRGKPVLFMADRRGDDAAAERELGRQNPDLTIIHAHGFDVQLGARRGRHAQHLRRVQPQRAVPPRHRDCLRASGARAVLFGSDQTLLSLGASVGLYLDAGLTPAERRLVLSENARRLFRL